MTSCKLEKAKFQWYENKSRYFFYSFAITVAKRSTIQ